MVIAKVRINKPVEWVWNVFTTPASWERWHGAGLVKVFPRWQEGAVLVWESGSKSHVTAFINHELIETSSQVIQNRYKFRLMMDYKEVQEVN